MTEKEIAALDSGKCPDCEKSDLQTGPRGGMSVNVKCANCGSKFNIVPGVPGAFGKERI